MPYEVPPRSSLEEYGEHKYSQNNDQHTHQTKPTAKPTPKVLKLDAAAYNEVVGDEHSMHPTETKHLAQYYKQQKSAQRQFKHRTCHVPVLTEH